MLFHFPCTLCFPVPEDLSLEERDELSNIRRRKKELLDDIEVSNSGINVIWVIWSNTSKWMIRSKPQTNKHGCWCALHVWKVLWCSAEQWTLFHLFSDLILLHLLILVCCCLLSWNDICLRHINKQAFHYYIYLTNKIIDCVCRSFKSCTVSSQEL